ncbi:protein translocase subunit SecD [Merismopedia glauca]|uniref:Protein translocase subunit SecD n=1 Tax=Merismopedia glauca CCAP 1448/3 TaxID=1296344 RepID=A0A2T1C345_9CYAN|nr:protein translocase subunit SecD [Merismopedia glauca]PSB02695.1 protein translocase subunit SecD [Merismopedia glauca CCAP 1448/3]
MQKQRSVLALIIVLVILAIGVLVARPIKLGLDLQGGSQLTLQLKTTAEVKEIKSEDLDAVKNIVENRINALGVAEPLIQTVGNDQIIVQLAGVNDPKDAERVLNVRAQLDFREQKPGTEGQLQAQNQVRQVLLQEKEKLNQSKDKAAIDKNKESLAKINEEIGKMFQSTGLTGKNLKDARQQPVGQAWEVSLLFDPEGGEKFAQLTKNLAGTGRSIGIFLDGEPISTPTVDVKFAQTGITGGAAVIEGNFSAKESYELGIQLRGGALPVPVEIVENRTVGATLGRDSIQRSIYAASGGLLLVLLFMGVYYRLPGAIADVSLVIYALLNLAVFALLGVVLTLPGIAGFILSIGMAVDANVLIFERTREELRAGKTLYRSVESGFYRAFSSILDSNVTTLIACGALFYFGSGLVKGFAVTLGIGVLISMFTALTCSRSLLLLAVLGFPFLRQRLDLFCPNLPTSVNS